MDFHEDTQLRVVLVGISAVVDSWKLYLTFRNFLAMEKMSTPPPELRMSTEGFDRMKSSIRLESSHILLTTALNSSIRALKIGTNYYSYVWELSRKDENTATARAMLFAALDEIMTHGFCIPAYVIMAIFRRVDPFLPVISITIKMTNAASIAAMYSYIRIQVHERFGPTGMLKMFMILNGVGLLVWAVCIRFLPQIRPATYKKLPYDEMGRAIRTLAISVGYPPDTIFMDERSPVPNAYYSNAILSESITINRFLTLFMDVPHLVGIVAHELGHWKYHHAYYEYGEQFAERTAACCLWAAAYGNERLLQIFRMGPGVHPIVAELLAYRFIWIPCSEVFYGVCRLINTRMETAADMYSCQIWNPKNLREALVRISSLMFKPSMLYDSWYSAWFSGYPTIVQRIRSIDTYVHHPKQNIMSELIRYIIPLNQTFTYPLTVMICAWRFAFYFHFINILFFLLHIIKNIYTISCEPSPWEATKLFHWKSKSTATSSNSTKCTKRTTQNAEHSPPYNYDSQAVATFLIHPSRRKHQELYRSRYHAPDWLVGRLTASVMDMNDDQVLRRVIMGSIIVVELWKSYLIFRNTLMVRDTPELPPELGISQMAYEKAQLVTQYDSERFLLITIVGLNIKLAKFVFEYFPYIWKLSGDYGKTLVSRAMWFTAIDNSLEVAVAIPIVFLGSLLTGGNPMLSVLDQIVEVVFRGLLAAVATYLVIYATDNFGVNIIMKGQLAINALGLLALAFYYRYMMSLDHERLPDNEVGRTVKALAKGVGYPSNTIYVDKRSPEPNAFYSSAIFSKIIIITEPLLTSLEAPQVASVVAHELGHWKYRHPLFTYLGQITEIVATGYFWMFVYGNPHLSRIFHLDPEIHPFIPAYVSFYFMWPPIRDIIQGIFNIFKTHFEFVADNYACSVWSPKHLRNALVKISTKLNSFPLLDNWFAAWFIGHPSIVERIQRIDGYKITGRGED